MDEFPHRPGTEELNRIRSGIRIMALRALGDPDGAEEVVQETILRLLEALDAGRLDDSGKLGAFAAGIARHVIADVRRGDAKVLPLDPAAEAARPAPGPDPLAALVSAEEAARVRDALARLAASDLEILRMVYFDGLTPGEVALRMGAPAPRIRKRKSRALERLRRAFLGRGGHAGALSPTDRVEGRAAPVAPGRDP